MGFGAIDRDQDRDATPVAEINTTPLVDVMLVLLIIFMVTAPLMTQAVKVDLPRVQAGADPKTRPSVTVEVDASGSVSLDGRTVKLEQLRSALAGIASSESQPTLRLQVDRDARYQSVAEVMAIAQSAGLSRIGFVTDPRR